MHRFLRNNAGKLLILAFAGGFALGEFVGLDQLLSYSRSAIENSETWIDTAAQAETRPTTANSMRGKVVGITDGDTLTLLVDRTQHKIRLGEIDTPERGQDWGARATRALSEKVFKKDVNVEVTDVDRYDRLVGNIWLGGRDINRELVREGHAWVYRQYLEDKSLLKDEAYAKEKQLGLWSLSNPVAPWEWRRGKRTRSATTTGKAFTCGTKTYCREMTSCKEARFYLAECGLTRLDGDGDGVPCEAICR